VEFEHACGGDGFEAGGIEFVFFDEGVDCAEDEQFGEDAEGVGVSGPVAAQIFAGVEVVDDPFVCGGCDYFGRFWISGAVLRK
jgi:hypothetical protein